MKIDRSIEDGAGFTLLNSASMEISFSAGISIVAHMGSNHMFLFFGDPLEWLSYDCINLFLIKLKLKYSIIAHMRSKIDLVFEGKLMNGHSACGS